MKRTVIYKKRTVIYIRSGHFIFRIGVDRLFLPFFFLLMTILINYLMFTIFFSYFLLWEGLDDIIFFEIFFAWFIRGRTAFYTKWTEIYTKWTEIYTKWTVIYTKRTVIYMKWTVIYTKRTRKLKTFLC